MILRSNWVETTVQLFRMLHAVFARFYVHGNSIYYKIILLKINIDLFAWPWLYDYADLPLQSSWEDVALEWIVKGMNPIILPPAMGK